MNTQQEANTPLDFALQFLTRPRRYQGTESAEAIFNTAKRIDLSFEGERIARWHWGSRGPHVLLVHGWESQAAHWHTWIDPMLQAGLQVSAIDLPAHGSATGKETDVVQCGRAVLSVYHSMSSVEGMIGHSMGSAACLYAFAHGATVNASVHLAGPSSLRRVIDYTAYAAKLGPSDREALLTAMNQRTRHAVDEMTPSRLSKGLRHDALIFHDIQDQEMPFKESEDLHQHWPCSRLIRLTDIGHRHILRNPDVIAQSIKLMNDATVSTRPIQPI